MAGERIARVVPLGDDAAVELLDRHPGRGEVRPLIVGAERPNRRPLVLQRHRHPSRRRILRLTLHSNSQAATDDRRLDAAELLPAVDSAVRVEHRGQQISRHVRPHNTGSRCRRIIAEVAAARSTNVVKSKSALPPARSDSARITSHGMPNDSHTCATAPPSISIALATELVQQALAGRLAIQVLVAGQHCAVDDLGRQRDIRQLRS